VINYTSKVLAIHRAGGAEFDKETGKRVEVEIEDPETGEIITGPKDVSRHAQTLADELDKIQQDLSDKKFKIQMDAIFKLQGLEDKEALNSAISRLENEISSEGISDNQMIIEYIMARILSMIRERGIDLEEDIEKILLKRILLSNKA
jgi:ribosome assembly protein YihI (activator of Der GTPase)